MGEGSSVKSRVQGQWRLQERVVLPWSRLERGFPPSGARDRPGGGGESFFAAFSTVACQPKFRLH